MVNFKIEDLGPLESLGGEEVFILTDDPSGSAISKKITATNLRKTHHGQIYAPDVSASQVLAATTWTQVDQFTVDGLTHFGGPDHTADKLVPSKVGRYLIGFHVAFVGDPGVTYKFAVHMDVATVPTLQAAVRTQTTVSIGGFGNVAAQGLVDVDPASVDIDLRVWASAATTIAVKDAGLWAFNPYPHE